jgi:type I restriction enzyme S subunit
VPPLDEQEAIVRFLDHVERRIRRYIAAKRRLIALLNEQKQAFVRQAVTRGFDPNVDVAPSGVDWLGATPQHWELRRLRFLADIDTGGRDTVDRKDDGEYPFFVRSQVVERIDTYAFDGEAVLTAGDGAGVAKVFHYITGKFDYHQRVYSFSRFRGGLDGRFFFYYLSANLRYEAFRETAKSTVDSLRRPMLANLPVAVPPLLEQNRIVTAVDAEVRRIEALMEATKREIEMLREYRTRLIADVVTGKLDVRGAADHLPDEVDELEPASDSEALLEGDESEDVVDLDLVSGEILA